MQFYIAETFTDSLARLTGEEQKLVKTTAFDLQINPDHPGMQFHKLGKGRDPNFWSVRVSRDIRLIVHMTEASLLLCYVDHHDAAYRWAERRKLETHPKTGAAQLIEVRETVQEIFVPIYDEVSEQVGAKPRLFEDVGDETLLSYGVPPEWLPDVRRVNEDSIFTLAEHLPKEAAEALIELATGGKPAILQPSVQLSDPFDHPDAQRRFREMNNPEELAAALAYPWDKWTIFLPPARRKVVEHERSMRFQLDDVTAIESFSHQWPSGKIEQFAHGWKGLVSFGFVRYEVKHGIGKRETYGRERVHTVTWVNGQPTVQGVEVDDYQLSRSLSSVLKRPDGTYAKTDDDVPEGYETFHIVNQLNEIASPPRRHCLAVKIREDDFPLWAVHAILRAHAKKQPGSPNTQSNRVSGIGCEKQNLASVLINKPGIVRALLNYGTQIGQKEVPFEPSFTANPEANRFVLANAFAFLVGVIFDQGIPYERAWAAP